MGTGWALLDAPTGGHRFGNGRGYLLVRVTDQTVAEAVRIV